MRPAKGIVLRALAERDIEGAFDHYQVEAGMDVALRFIDALENACAAVGANPGIGSPRFAHELEIPGLRHKSVPGFPWLIFYVERDHVDVWRVLHAHRDIPAWLIGEGEPD